MPRSLREQLCIARDDLWPRKMCAKKKRYFAQWYAKRVMRECMVKRPDEQLYVYHCPECSGWHITRMQQ